ncbi:aldo/keto reductase [Lactiplantibacillus paraplantarum]|uniref:Aldo/keto reductase n=1 Tax=Lactiplantibacillus paraplantarum TaxID=60520 RepID=A0AAD0TP07_9LACO|nr:aldo/keto reductase [Lactiplantibacillus paraplantarum]AVW10459.1 aldo/keto reductase [Lactiplantibacillus paraplantarum]AYJ38704.1 aldo/keto reductase [Lactiplantibacillus paraplantarum]ERL44206.1 aldo/keto reductase [Lactiplantibacillus paraplantarum]KRL51535.1 aldo keto reductase [Lactiplantibacillus paraplantarum DSM 10667]MCU4683788.1 aldo/keto reductase [Lactiplantibacillus paraplantarum]
MPQLNETLPAVALGTWSWGAGMAGGDQVFGNHLFGDDLKPVVESAMRQGLNLFDTAYAYGVGASEQILGDLLKPYQRQDYLLSTKFTPQMASGERAVAAMLAGSLQRLNTDYIDIYWIHNPADIEKWTPQLIPLVKNGQVKRVGVSNHNLAQLKRVNEILGAEGLQASAVQNHYSLLYRSSEEAGLLDYCREHDINFFAYMVLEQGALSGKYDAQHPLPAGSQRAETYNKVLPQLEDLTAAMKQIGTVQDASVAEIATAYAMQKGTIPIVGVTKEKYVADEVKASQLQLSTTDIETLERLATKTGINPQAAWEDAMN